jgi:predicted RNA polymerase sigma factor
MKFMLMMHAPRGTGDWSVVNHNLFPDVGEVAGLLALMLLTDARRPARTGPDGELIPLTEQDRTLWDRNAIAEGVALITDTLSRGAGLELLEALDADERMAGHYPLDAVRAHLFEMAGDHEAAIAHYQTAAGRTTSIPETNYVASKAARLIQSIDGD